MLIVLHPEIPDYKIPTKDFYLEIRNGNKPIKTRSRFVWQLILMATIVAFWIVWEDLCSLQHETSERKLVKISGEWFCHNNGIKKRTGNLLPIVRQCHCFGRDNSSEAKSWVTLFKGRPPAICNAAQGCLVFLYSGGTCWCPSHASRTSASFIFSKIETSPPFRKINSLWKIVLVVFGTSTSKNKNTTTIIIKTASLPVYHFSFWKYKQNILDFHQIRAATNNYFDHWFTWGFFSQ